MARACRLALLLLVVAGHAAVTPLPKPGSAGRKKSETITPPPTPTSIPQGDFDTTQLELEASRALILGLRAQLARRDRGAETDAEERKLQGAEAEAATLGRRRLGAAGGPNVFTLGSRNWIFLISLLMLVLLLFSMGFETLLSRLHHLPESYQPIVHKVRRRSSTWATIKTSLSSHQNTPA